MAKAVQTSTRSVTKGRSKTVRWRPVKCDHSGYLFEGRDFYRPGEEPWSESAIADPESLALWKEELLRSDQLYLDFETGEGPLHQKFQCNACEAVHDHHPSRGCSCGSHDITRITEHATNNQRCILVGVALGPPHRYLPIRTLPLDPRLDWEQHVLPIIEEMLDRGKTIVVHNGGFDLPLLKRFAQREPEQWEDTMIMAWLSDPHRRKGLKVLHRGIVDPTAENKSYKETVGNEKILSRVPLVRAAEYAAHDSAMTEELFPVLKQELESKGLWEQYRYQKRQWGLVDWMRESGMPVDRDLLLTMRGEAQTYRDRCVAEITQRMRRLAVERKKLIDSGEVWKTCPETKSRYRVNWPFGLNPEKITCVLGAGGDDVVTSLEGIADPWSLDPTLINKRKARKALREDPHKLNLRSTEQMSEFLFDVLALPTDQWDNIKEGINKSMLIRLRRDGFEVADSLLQFSRVNKLLSGFYEPLLQRLVKKNGWWWVFTTFNPFSVATGRWSSEDPNLQNIPNAVKGLMWSAVRAAFCAPPGWKLVVADLSQIELRLMAHYSRDANMIRIYQEGGDIHAMTGAKLAGVSYEEFRTWEPDADKPADTYNEREQQYALFRKRAKPVNFGVSYMMGGPSFATYAADNYDIWLSVDEAWGYIESFYDLYQGIPKYHLNVLKRLVHRGEVPSYGGRRFYFDSDLARYTLGIYQERQRAKARGVRSRRLSKEERERYRLGESEWRKAVNGPIQGSAADMIVRSMLRLMGEFRTSPYVKLICQVHDEVLLLVRDDYVSRVVPFVQDAMTSTAELLVPLSSSVKCEQNWLAAH